MTEPLKTITVVVDRRVLAELLGYAGETFDTIDAQLLANRAFELQREVSSGKRTTLFAKDWVLPSGKREG
jgi:hypothetical protein